jgi:RNA polymerase sigma-70 factor (ECF subfamily)
MTGCHSRTLCDATALPRLTNLNVPSRWVVWTVTMSASRVAIWQGWRLRALDNDVAESAGVTWFRTVGRHELDRAYRLAGFILGDAREAEDATQDALLRAWRQRRSLRQLGSAQAWFDRILVNGCRDRLRRRRSSVRWAEVDDAVSSAAADPFASLLARDSVLRALSTLPPEQRIALILRYWADLPIDAVADRLGIPAGTAKSRLHYAMQALRVAMGPTR